MAVVEDWGGMNAYRVDKDRGEDVDKIGGCPQRFSGRHNGGADTVLMFASEAKHSRYKSHLYPQ